MTDGTLQGLIEIKGVRDYGIKILASAIQQSGTLHIYGVSSDAPRTNPAEALWITTTGGGFQGNCLYLESADIGALLEANSIKLTNLYSHSCKSGNIVVAANSAYNQVTNFEIGQPTSGNEPTDGAIKLAWGWQKFSDGTIVVPAGTTGFKITDGRAQRLTDVYLFLYNGAKGIDVVGTTANPENQLNNSIIEVHFDAETSGSNGAVGLDLNEGGTDRLGERNRIIVTTRGGATWNDPQTIVDLPTGWQTAISRTTTNLVEINGVRWYPPSDE